MLVKMLVKIGGTRCGEEWPDVGDTIDLPEVEARDMIISRYCEEVTGETNVRNDAGAAAAGDDDTSTAADGSDAGSLPDNLDNLDRPALFELAVARGLNPRRNASQESLVAMLRAAVQ